MRWHRLPISIHALREEGDGKGTRPIKAHKHFYPRPPRGGRRADFTDPDDVCKISIHALREEGDEAFMEISLHKTISIHALREEGDAGGDADADT